MNKKANLQHNRVYHLEDTMIMYGKYNSDMLMDLINTVHHMQNLTSWKEKMFVGKMTEWVKKELAKSKEWIFLFFRYYLVFNNYKGEIC